MPRVLIAGCGYVGTATADLFQAAGWEVEGWTHSEDSASQLSAKPYPVRAVDITDRDACRARAAHSMRSFIAPAPAAGGAESYRRVYFEGATNLIRILQPDHFSLRAALPSTRKRTANGSMKIALPSRSTRRERSCARPKKSLGKVAPSWRVSRVFTAPAAPPCYASSSQAKRDSRMAADAIRTRRTETTSPPLFCISRSLPDDPGLVNVTDDEPLTQRECYEWLTAKLNRPLPPERSQTRDRKRGSSNKRVSNQKMRTLGWAPQFPSFPAGMEKSVLLTSRELGS